MTQTDKNIDECNAFLQANDPSFNDEWFKDQEDFLAVVAPNLLCSDTTTEAQKRDMYIYTLGLKTFFEMSQK